MRIECVNPILHVKDVAVSREFYVDVLGFSEAAWGTPEFTFMARDGAGVYLSQGGQGHTGTWVWIGFDGDINELYENVRSKGVTIREAPTNYSWALEMKIEDPDGHVLRFGTEPNPNEPYVDQT